MENVVKMIPRFVAGLGFAALAVIFLLLTLRVFGILGEILFYGSASVYLFWRLR